MDAFFKCFVALFVAIDALGATPFVAGLLKEAEDEAQKKLLFKAVFAALIIGSLFLGAGDMVFRLLGITADDFRVAGGLLLLIFAIRDLAIPSSHQGSPSPTRIGIVPIAVPLMMGPAALTTLMVSSKEFGLTITLIALVLNLAIAWFLFRRSLWIIQKMGEETGDAIAKVFSLFLAAIAIMLIRQGLTGMIQQF